MHPYIHQFLGKQFMLQGNQILKIYRRSLAIYDNYLVASFISNEIPHWILNSY